MSLRAHAHLLVLTTGMVVVATVAILVAVDVTEIVLDETLYKQSAVHYTTGLPDSLFHDLTARATARLYPLLMAPFFAVFDGDVAVRWARAVNGVFFAASALPVYLLARQIELPRWPAVFAALASIAVPWLTLATAMFTESLSLLIFAWTLLAMVHALRRPLWWRDALVLLGIAGLICTRAQLVSLLPAWMLAVAVREVRAAGAGTRRRAHRGAQPPAHRGGRRRGAPARAAPGGRRLAAPPHPGGLRALLGVPGPQPPPVRRRAGRPLRGRRDRLRRGPVAAHRRGGLDARRPGGAPGRGQPRCRPGRRHLAGVLSRPRSPPRTAISGRLRRSATTSTRCRSCGSPRWPPGRRARGARLAGGDRRRARAGDGGGARACRSTARHSCSHRPPRRSNTSCRGCRAARADVRPGLRGVAPGSAHVRRPALTAAYRRAATGAGARAGPRRRRRRRAARGHGVRDPGNPRRARDVAGRTPTRSASPDSAGSTARRPAARG